MPNYVKGKRKAAAARKGHKRTTTRKSHAGVRKGAWARRAKLRRKKK